MVSSALLRSPTVGFNGRYWHPARRPHQIHIPTLESKYRPMQQRRCSKENLGPKSIGHPCSVLLFSIQILPFSIKFTPWFGMKTWTRGERRSGVCGEPALRIGGSPFGSAANSNPRGVSITCITGMVGSINAGFGDLWCQVA